ncbi:PDDEXK-like family protein [Mucilaginibacter sp.]
MSVTNHKTQALLDKIGVIDFKYQKVRQANKFNVFNLLANKFDEVHFHSKFLYELLHPEGSHGYGTSFLNLFLNRLGLDAVGSELVNVYKEYKNIDILIRTSKQAVVIENKLYASDQDKQLERYYEILRKEGVDDIKLVYLSIDGKEPDTNSIGKLFNLPDWLQIYIPISYSFEILFWIEDCIKESYNFPALRETLIQYQLIINNITGKTMNHDERTEILALLAEGDNIVNAKKIAENWVHVKWHTEWDFWTDLEAIVSKEYAIMDRCKFSADKLNGVIHRSRNRLAWYGIMFKLNEYKNCEICLFVERGWEDVYYGITVIRNGNRDVSKEPKFVDLAKIIEEVSEWGRENSWLGGNFCEPRINFEQFSNETTLKLLNTNERNNYITKLWTQIKEYVFKVNALIDN